MWQTRQRDAGFMPDDSGRDPEGLDADEDFDSQVNLVLEVDADLLSEHAELLMTAGSTVIARAGAVMLRASLKLPTRWRSGVLRIAVERADGASSSSSIIPLYRTQHPAQVADELPLHLAIQLASLAEQ